MTTDAAAVNDLAADRVLLSRTSTADRVAGILRSRGRNRQILERLQSGDGPGAADDLDAYLRYAEHRLVRAYAERQATAGT